MTTYGSPQATPVCAPFDLDRDNPDLARVLVLGWQQYRRQILPRLWILVPIVLANMFVATIPSLWPDWYRSGLVVIALYLAAALITKWSLSLVYIATAHLVEESLWGTEIGLKDAVRRSLRRFWPVIGMTILKAFILCFLFLLLLIPGIIYSGYYQFTIFAVMLRGVSGRKAMSYSKKLVEGQWWLLLLYGLALYVIYYVLVIPFTISTFFMPWFPWSFVIIMTIAQVLGYMGSVTFIVWFLNIDYRRHPEWVADRMGLTNEGTDETVDPLDLTSEA